MKKCSKCKETKELLQFAADKSRWDKLQGSCRQCKNVLSAKIIIAPCHSCGENYRVTYIEYRKRATHKCPACFSNGASLRAKTQVGSNNPHWKGGVSKEGKAFYTSREWREARTKTFKRDNFTCQDCGKHGGYLEANHVKPRATNLELRLVLSNLETLCRPCHIKKTILQHQQGAFK